MRVPPYLPDVTDVRGDILDYYLEVERVDNEVGRLLRQLERAGKLDNTIVVMTGDNGWPFPRSKANLYDSGSRQPFAVRWPAAVRGGRVLDDFVTLADLPPTFLEAAGLKPPPDMTGRSMLGLLSGSEAPGECTAAFLERERLNNAKNDVATPMKTHKPTRAGAGRAVMPAVSRPSNEPCLSHDFVVMRLAASHQTKIPARSATVATIRFTRGVHG